MPGLKKRFSPFQKLILLAVAAAGVVVCSFLIGRYPLSLKEIVGILMSKFFRQSRSGLIRRRRF